MTELSCVKSFTRPVFSKYELYKFKVNQDSKSGHALNPPRTMIIDMTDPTVFLTTLASS